MRKRIDNSHAPPPTEYDEALNETWAGRAVSGQYITVNVQHEKGNEKKTLAVWEYKEYRFSLMGEDASNVAIPKAALCVIENLDCSPTVRERARQMG